MFDGRGWTMSVMSDNDEELGETGEGLAASSGSEVPGAQADAAELDAPAEDEELVGQDEEEPIRPPSPYDRPGSWYVVHTYAGYENKVKSNLESRISSMNMEDRIYEVVIPMEDVVEFKGGKKVTVHRKVF